MNSEKYPIELIPVTSYTKGLETFLCVCVALQHLCRPGLFACKITYCVGQVKWKINISRLLIKSILLGLPHKMKDSF